ncbi:GIY-YIG nuclease family protein [Spiroplasma chrysopicola]|uniref:Putative endonuclease n=1 Tax=Spiroplasma chrysopicola DF-1 TaxID=1276227 RepID=R4UF28_9MOLU|nr:GIY-YIG nuclease family protein [Spiroplasma chrysopicola]AGM24720.1 putative endonuclease [Spiroplasma chrysopicola DF-1]
MAEKFYFYVLHCADNTLYAGYTVDLEKRLLAHNNGQGAKYTRIKTRQPLRLIYSESYPTKSLAMQREYHFKQLTRPEKEKFLVTKNVYFNDNKIKKR